MKQFAKENGLTYEVVQKMLEVDREDLNEISVDKFDPREAAEGELIATIENKYMAALAELYRFQVECGTNQHLFFKTPALKTILSSKARERYEASKLAYNDHGTSDPNATYSEKEFTALNRALLRQAESKKANVRILSLLHYSLSFCSIFYTQLHLFRNRERLL